MKFAPLPILALLMACNQSAAPTAANAMQPGSPMSAVDYTLDFEGDAVGAVPSGFSGALTGKGRPGVWRVEMNGQGHVVAQTDADATNYRFPLLVFDGMQARDVDLRVRFFPVSGQVDQAAGLVWRYRDANNYYIVRANALEGNLVLYKVENGKRHDLAIKGSRSGYGVKASVASNRWSELRVTARGTLFEVYLGGTKLFEVEDATFALPGKVGLWTKADSVTRFDDLAIADLDHPRAAPK